MPTYHSFEDAFQAYLKPEKLIDGPKVLPEVNLCNCIGPQPGQTKCPCVRKLEAEERVVENKYLPEDYKLKLTGRSGG